MLAVVASRRAAIPAKLAVVASRGTATAAWRSAPKRYRSAFNRWILIPVWFAPTVPTVILSTAKDLGRGVRRFPDESFAALQ